MAEMLDKEQEYWTCIKTYWKYKQQKQKETTGVSEMSDSIAPSKW